jgi:hypothetical protein
MGEKDNTVEETKEKEHLANGTTDENKEEAAEADAPEGIPTTTPP